MCTKAYIESDFNKLNILHATAEKEYIRTTPTTVPDAILFSCILFYKVRFYPKDVALEVTKLINDENSPGRLLFMNEYRFRESLERLRIDGLITIESFANLDQIKFLKTTDYLESLSNYYKSKI